LVGLGGRFEVGDESSVPIGAQTPTDQHHPFHDCKDGPSFGGVERVPPPNGVQHDLDSGCNGFAGFDFFEPTKGSGGRPLISARTRAGGSRHDDRGRLLVEGDTRVGVTEVLVDRGQVSHQADLYDGWRLV
jgi:hypothetical protein